MKNSITSNNNYVTEPQKPIITAFVIASLGLFFLFFSYSSNHYWDEYFYLYSVATFPLPDLLSIEPDLGKGLFPQAFFSAKMAFVAFLYILTTLFPEGGNSLFFIQFVFALQSVILSCLTYLLLSQLFEKRDSLYMSIIFLFLPLTSYFSYKILSEYFSLSWIVLGSFCFLMSFSSISKKRLATLLILSVTFIFIGVLCRFTSILFFGGLVASLFLVNDRRFPRFKLFCYSTCVVFAVIASTLIFYQFAIGLSLKEMEGLLRSVTVRSHGIVIKVYSIGMCLQLFCLPLMFCFKRFFSKHFLFAAIWLIICAVPFLFLSQYVEPRYFYMASVAMAILIFFGLQDFASLLAKYFPIKCTKILVLVSVVIIASNRLFFANLMPYELDQARYNDLLASSQFQSDSTNIVVPWISDFCFLKFQYPERNIHLAWSSKYGEDHEFFRNPSFVTWAGGKNYIGTEEKLLSLTPPVYYIGWRYNQPAVKIKERLMWLKSGYVNAIEVHEGLKNHLAESWIWNSPIVNLVPVDKMEPYEAFLVQYVNKD